MSFTPPAPSSLAATRAPRMAQAGILDPLNQDSYLYFKKFLKVSAGKSN